MKQRRVKKKKEKRLFEPGWEGGYILFTVSTMALHGDIVVEMPFPQCPPPSFSSSPLVNMFAVSVTTGPPSQTRREGKLAESSCLFSSFLLLVNLFH